ncbi:hypothetical protein NPIL_375991, partial [Nephila pilipes]
VEDLHQWWKKSRRARASSFGHRRSLSLKASRMGDPRLLMLSQPLDATLPPSDPSNKTVAEDNESDTTTTVSSVFLASAIYPLAYN